MGQEHNRLTNPVLDSTWVTLTRDNPPLFSNVNPFAKRTFRNTTNNQEVEQYLIQFASQYDFRHYAQELRERMEPSNTQGAEQSNPDSYYNLSPYIYTVKYFVNNSLQDMCSTVYKGLLYVQKVDLRLKEINDIPLSDQLYLTKATLQGFKLLYQRVGYFDITEEMIFITKEGKVKVWINSNLSKNEPIYLLHVASKDAHGSQSDMIVQLLDLIEENTDSQQQECVHFKQYLTKKGIYDRLSFYRALEEFQAYCIQHHLVVESNMKSIYELYHQDQPEHSDVLEQSVRKPDNVQSANLIKQSQVKVQKQFGHIHRNSLVQLQMPKSETEMASSQISRHNQRQSKSIFHPDRREEVNRPRSINTSYAQKMHQVTFNHSQLPPFPNYQHKTIQMPSYPSHFLNTVNIPQPIREMSPVARTRVPSNTHNSRSQNKSIVQNPKPAVIKFNYVASQDITRNLNLPQPLQPKQPHIHVIPNNLITMKSIRTESRASTKQMNNYTTEAKDRNRLGSINYYTSNETYTLDREIAEDLQKFLGYDINS